MKKEEKIDFLNRIFNQWRGVFRARAIQRLEYLKTRFNFESGYLYRPYSSYPVWKIIISGSAAKIEDYYFNEPHKNEGIDPVITAFLGYEEMKRLCMEFIDSQTRPDDDIFEVCSKNDNPYELEMAVELLFENSSFYIAVDKTFIQKKYSYFKFFSDSNYLSQKDFEYIEAKALVRGTGREIKISSAVISGLKDIEAVNVLPFTCAMVKWLYENSNEELFQWRLYFLPKEDECRIIAENCISGNTYFPHKFVIKNNISVNFILRIESAGKKRINIFLERAE